MKPLAPAQPGGTGTPAVCPACNRFIGPTVLCPYCGAPSRRGLTLQVLRGTALGLAVGGLLALYMYARTRQPAAARIAEVTPLLHLGRVQIEGRVLRPPRCYRREGQLQAISFLLHDGTGQIIVSATRGVALELERHGRIPAAGDRVRAAGTLNVTGPGKTRLNLMSADDLVVERAAETMPAEAAP